MNSCLPTKPILITVLSSLVTLILGMRLVSGQTVTIQFDKIGEFDYNGGKAFLEGSDVFFLCDIRGAEIQTGHTIAFKKDGEQITSGVTVLGPNSPVHYFVQHNVLETYEQFKLFIYDVSKVDQGFYTCEIQDSNGALVKQGQYTNTPEAQPRITVLYVPDRDRYPDCSVVEGTTDVKVGSKINLRCTSELGSPRIQLTWKHIGFEQGNNDVTGSVSPPTSDDEITNSVPAITITPESNGDIYTCFMKPNTTLFPNDLRTCDIGPLNVISDVPLPVIMPPTQNAIPGDTVNFQCELPGQDDAQLTWFWDPNWIFSKNPVSPDSKYFSLLNVRSYHHLTKVYCRTVSQGVNVTVYGLIRVSGPYDEEPPNTPAPSVIKPQKPVEGGSDGTGGTDGTGTGGSGGTGTGGNGGSGTGSGGSGGSNGGASPTEASGLGRTTKSGGRGIVIQTVNSKTVLTCLCFGILFVRNTI